MDDRLTEGISAERIFAVLGVGLLAIGLFNLYDPPGLFRFLSPGDSYIVAILASFFVLVLGFIFTMGAIAVSIHRDADREEATAEMDGRERRIRRSIAGVCLVIVAVAAWSTFLSEGDVFVTVIGSLQFLVVLTLVGAGYVGATSILVPRVATDD